MKTLSPPAVKKPVIMLIMLMLILSQVHARTPQAVLEEDTDTLSVRIDTSFAEKAAVTFTPHETAGGYFLTATETKGKKRSVSSWTRSRSDGSGEIKTMMQGLVPDTEYTLEIMAFLDSGETVVHHTGKTFRTRPLPEEPPKHTPATYLRSVTEKDPLTGTFTAVLTTIRTPGLIYEASIVTDPSDIISRTCPAIMPLGEETSIKSLTTDSVITVRHGKATDAGILWSNEKTVITFPDDIDLYDEDFSLAVSDDGAFSWKGAEGTPSLFRYTREGGSELLETAGKAGEGTFSYEEKRSLESALYYAATETQVSSPVFWTSGPAVTVTTTQQDIVLTWREPGNASIAYSGIMTPAKDRNGNVTLHISGLDSDTEYPFRIKAIFGDGRTAETSFSVRTESFAGTYEWMDRSMSSKSVPSFRVTVKEAPEESDFGYWIFTDRGDPKCIEDGPFHEIRLMPLFDESVGEVATTDFTDFHGKDPHSESYRWNEGKWNRGSLHPNSWMPVSMKVKQDRYESVVKSKAAFSVKVDTRTIFEFFVGEDGTPMLRFTNRAEGSNASLANGALYRNMQPDTALGEDEWTYVLRLVQDI